MSPPIRTQPVCVTGASGFIAAHIVEQLLDAGYSVRGTVRNIEKTRSQGYLHAMPGADNRLELAEADLLQPESFEAAVAGCEYLIHTASPYIPETDNPHEDLVRPAIEGTMAVMRAAQKAGTVKRIVLTSSPRAIYGFGDDRDQVSEGALEPVIDRGLPGPYYHSKREAEKAAWKFIEEESPRFDLVVINPALVIGPSHGPSLNASNSIIANFTKGEYPGIINLEFPTVDVRDVATAHIKAMENPQANGRYLTAAETWTMRELVEALSEDADYKWPSLPFDNRLGNVVVKLGARFQPKGVRDFLRAEVGNRLRADTSKIEDDLGMK